MVRLRHLLRLSAVFVTAAVAFGLSGCGASPASQVASTATPSAAALGGNWLIVGSLPFSNPVGPVVNGNFGLSITFAVTGNNLVAATAENLGCGSLFTSGAGTIATGAVAASGSFTLASVSTGTTSTGPNLQMSATAPATGATTFSGTYTYTTTGSCATSQAGSFTATRIADVTGSYVGSASFTTTSLTTVGGTLPATITLNLQQGAVLAGATSTDQEVLAGTISVKGVSCFATGTATIPGSGVLGTTGLVIFTMNDGSTLNVLFDNENVGSTRLAILSVSDSGGACGTLVSNQFEVVKQ